jgi:hypothetical protein
MSKSFNSHRFPDDWGGKSPSSVSVMEEVVEEAEDDIVL